MAEGGPGPDEGGPAAVVIAAAHADEALAAILDTVDCAYGRSTPRLVVLSGGSPDGPARALALGADDVVAPPVHLGELATRIGLRIRHRAGSLSQPGGELHAAMRDLVEDIAPSLRAEELLHSLVERVGRALDLSHCSFVLTPSGADHGRVLAEYREPTTRDFRLELARYPEIVEAIRTGRPVVIPDVHSDPLFEDIRRRWAKEELQVAVQSVVALPVSVAGAVVGVFLLRPRDPGATLTAAQVSFADALAQAAAKMLELSRGAPSLPRDAKAVDPLTGCGTPGALESRLHEEFERARRYALSFSLVLLDVDRVRELGEQLSADVGDRILAGVGGILRSGVRASDFVCRYSGDEFAMLLPETDAGGARQSVYRVRDRLGAQPFDGVDQAAQPRLTAGIVTFPHPAAGGIGDLFALAEAALLRARGQTGERIGTAEAVAT